MSEYEYATGKQSGWVCPICGRVFAPWVPECTYHNPGLPNMYPQVDYVHKDSTTQLLTGDGDYFKHLTGNAK